MTEEEFQALEAQHGGIRGTPTALNPTTTDPLTGLKGPNPNPTYEYVFNDGKVLRASSHLDENGQKIGYSVYPGSTAVIGKQATTTSSAPKTVRGANGMIYTENPDGTLTPQVDTSKAPSAGLQIPDPLHPGQSIDATPEEYKAYYNSQRGQDQTTIAQKQLELNKLKQDAQQYKDDLVAQRTQGQITNEEATQKFDQWWKLNVQAPVDQFNAQRDVETTGQTAGRDAVTNARYGVENRVGPEFGAHFASALQGVAQGNPSLVQFGASDFTYPTPNYDAIAQAAAARAVAHLSPYAAAISGRGAPAYQPSVVGAAANSVVSQQAQPMPTTSPYPGAGPQ